MKKLFHTLSATFLILTVSVPTVFAGGSTMQVSYSGYNLYAFTNQKNVTAGEFIFEANLPQTGLNIQSIFFKKMGTLPITMVQNPRLVELPLGEPTGDEKVFYGTIDTKRNGILFKTDFFPLSEQDNKQLRVLQLKFDIAEDTSNQEGMRKTTPQRKWISFGIRGAYSIKAVLTNFTDDTQTVLKSNQMWLCEKGNHCNTIKPTKVIIAPEK